MIIGEILLSVKVLGRQCSELVSFDCGIFMCLGSAISYSRDSGV